MPSLRTAPGTSTAKQRQRIGIDARRLGFDLAEVRAWFSVDSLTELSSAQASECIKRMDGGDLPRPPGTGSRPPARAARGSTRIITREQISEIKRLLDDYFNDGLDMARKQSAWLRKIYGVEQVRDIGTSQAANRCIWALQRMIKDRAAATRPIWKEST